MSDLGAAHSVEQRIGAKIRAMRTDRHVTLEQLAREVRLTKGQLSKIENGKVSSPVSTLTRIAAVLGVSPGHFFQESDELRAVQVPRQARKPVVGRGSKQGHSYESLAFGLCFEKDFESYLIRIEERRIDPDRNIFRHPGQELLFMTRGAMDYQHSGRIYHLKAGDSLFFDANLNHGPVKVYHPPVEFVCVISNPKK